MTYKWMILAGVLAMAGCAQQDGFDTAGPGAGAGTTGAAAGVTPGSADDPTSAAFFQQAVGDRVFFVVDQSTLTDEARTILAAQATWLTQNPDFSAIIEGHADERGTREYNVALGERRANAAREFLVSRGVPSNRLQIVSFGKERPIEICSDEACYTKNRRAVTVLSAGLSG